GSFTLAGTVSDAPRMTRAAVAAAKDGCMTAQVLAPRLTAKDLQFKLYPAITGTVVTLMGNRMSNVHMRENADWEKQPSVFLIAFDGPPSVKAEVDQIWNDYYTDDSLDGDA